MTDEQREAVKALDALEIPVSRIAEVLHMHRDSVRRVIDPEYAETRRAQVRFNSQTREERRKHSNTHAVWRSRVDEDALRLQKEIPEDDRDLTGKLLGDPPSARSALAQKDGRA